MGLSLAALPGRQFGISVGALAIPRLLWSFLAASPGIRDRCYFPAASVARSSKLNTIAVSANPSSRLKKRWTYIGS